MKVMNMLSAKGNKIANQFMIEDGDKEYFQSYASVIVLVENGKTTLDEQYWDYSVTTGKYRNMYLGENKKETEAKIESGEYTLANSNK